MSFNRQPIDGLADDLYHSRIGDCSKDDEEAHLREFAILCHATALAAVPFQDRVHPIGKRLSAEEVEEWQGLVHLFMRLADLHTFGAEGTRGEVKNALRDLYRTMQGNDAEARGPDRRETNQE